MGQGQVPNSEKDFVTGFIAETEKSLRGKTEEEIAYSLGLLEDGIDDGKWDLAEKIIEKAPHLLASEATASGISGAFMRNPNSGEESGSKFVEFLLEVC